MEQPIPTSVRGAAVTDDGRHVDLTFVGEAGEVSLRIPAEQLPHLAILIAMAGGKSEAIQKQGPTTARYVIPTAKWRVFAHPDGAQIERWLGKSAQGAKWNFRLRSA